MDGDVSIFLIWRAAANRGRAVDLEHRTSGVLLNTTLKLSFARSFDFFSSILLQHCYYQMFTAIALVEATSKGTGTLVVPPMNAGPAPIGPGRIFPSAPLIASAPKQKSEFRSKAVETRR